MVRSLPFTLLAAAALASGGMAYAQTPAARPSAAHAVAGKTATRTTMTKRVAANPAGGRMVTTKTATGKTVTYDCAKAGNATKKACAKS